MIKDFETYIEEGRLGRIMSASKEETIRKEDAQSSGTNISQMKPIDIGTSVLWADRNLVDYDDKDDFYTFPNAKSLYPHDKGKHYFNYYLDVCSGRRVKKGKYVAEMEKYGWRLPTYNECKELCDKYKTTAKFVLDPKYNTWQAMLDHIEIDGHVFPADGCISLDRKFGHWRNLYSADHKGLYMCDWMRNEHGVSYQVGFFFCCENSKWTDHKQVDKLKMSLSLGELHDYFSVRLVKDKE